MASNAIFRVDIGSATHVQPDDALIMAKLTTAVASGHNSLPRIPSPPWTRSKKQAPGWVIEAQEILKSVNNSPEWESILDLWVKIELESSDKAPLEVLINPSDRFPY